jgi:hypothetical protein
MILRWSWLIAVGLIAFPRPLLAQAATPDEFKSRILAEWKTLLGQVRTVRIDKQGEAYRSRAPKTITPIYKGVARIAFNQAGILRGGEQEDFDENGKAAGTSRTLTIWNQQYRASLMKRKGRDNWVLTEHVPGNEGQPSRFELAFPWLSVGHVSLFEWIQEPTFEITRLEPREEDSGALVRMHFRNPVKQVTKGSDTVQSGYIDFDTTHSYRPTKYEYHLKAPAYEGLDRGTLEYRTGNGIPVITKAVHEAPETRHKTMGTFSSNEIETFKIEYNVDVRDEEFRLSYYGLPEPVGVTWKKPVPTYVWFILAAVVSLVLALTCRYVARRSRTRLTSIQPGEN